MVLILTSTGDATADYVTARLDALKYDYVRLDTDTIPNRISISIGMSSAHLRVGKYCVDAAQVSAIWYRRPEPVLAKADSPEHAFVAGEWSAALENFLSLIPERRWINHPLRNALALNKFHQKSIALQLGLLVPRSVLTQDPAEVIALEQASPNGIVIKPLHSGYIERQGVDADSVIYTNSIEKEKLQQLLPLLPACPTFFEERLIPQFDCRVTVIDDLLFPVSLVRQDQSVDIRRGNFGGVKYEAVDLPENVSRKLLQFVKAYHLRFSAIDMIVNDQGEWYFLENNPNGQWAWLDQVGVTKISDALISSFSQ